MLTRRRSARHTCASAPRTAPTTSREEISCLVGEKPRVSLCSVLYAARFCLLPRVFWPRDHFGPTAVASRPRPIPRVLHVFCAGILPVERVNVRAHALMYVQWPVPSTAASSACTSLRNYFALVPATRAGSSTAGTRRCGHSLGEGIPRRPRAARCILRSLPGAQGPG